MCDIHMCRFEHHNNATVVNIGRNLPPSASLKARQWDSFAATAASAEVRKLLDDN